MALAVRIRRVQRTRNVFQLAIASGLALTLALIELAGTASAASGGVIYVTPASGTYATGATVAVTVRENSNSEQVNAVQADMTYSSNLQYLSIDGSQSAFGVDANKTAGNGSVSIARGNTSPLTGDKLVAVVNFKVTAAGAASIQMQSTSQLMSYSTNTDITSTRTGATYNGNAGNGGTTTPPATPPATPPVTPSSGTGSGSTSGSTKTSSPTVKITSNGVSTTTGNTPKATTTGPSAIGVELSGPTTIETTPGSDKKVTKVEYYLNKKLIATLNGSPYKHTLDTSHVRNGTYMLTTKTYYADNSVDAVDTSVVVNNPMSATQLLLQAKHFWWLVLIVVLVLGDIIWMAVHRRKHAKNGPVPPAATGGGANGQPAEVRVYGGNEHGPYSAVITPSQPASQAPASPAPQTEDDLVASLQNQPSVTVNEPPQKPPTDTTNPNGQL